jgi:hypothetical protein
VLRDNLRVAFQILHDGIPKDLVAIVGFIDSQHYSVNPVTKKLCRKGGYAYSRKVSST